MKKMFNNRLIFILITIVCCVFMIGCKKTPTECKLTIIYGKDYDNQEIVYEYNAEVIMPEKIVDEKEDQSVHYFTNEDIEEVIFPFNIKEDMVIYAEWDKAIYTYKFMCFDEETVFFEYSGQKGDDIVFPETTPEREAGDHVTYVFSNWYPNIKQVKGNTTFVPRYDRIDEEEKVTFFVEDKEYYTEDVIYRYSAYEPDIPHIDPGDGKYAMFMGWKEEGKEEFFDFTTEITKDINLYACFDVDVIYQKPLSECTVSVLGDSVSTFYSQGSKINSIYMGTNDYYYPIYSETVKSVDKTWWYQVITGIGAKFGVIESKSGSTLVGSGETDKRLNNLYARAKGVPNIVLVQMTGNDNVSNIETTEVARALNKVYTYITDHYVEKTDKGFVIPQVYFVTASYSATTYGNYTEQHRLEYNEEMRKIAALHDNCHVYDLAELITSDNYLLYLGDSLHYNAAGMKVHADGFIKKIKEDWE